LEDQKNRGKEKENHQLYELARAKGIAVKGDEGETNRGDIEVDCHYLEKETRLETRGCRWGRFLLVGVTRLFVGVAAGERGC
jgi:hypothetical protein